MILQTSTQEKGPGFWKLNTSLLQDKEYVDIIKQVIQETVEINSNADPQLLWDTIKLQIRGKSIQYSSRKKREIKNGIKILEKQIQDLELKYSEEPSQNTLDQLTQLKEELDRDVEKCTKGAYIRSRARWQEEGERSTKYFLNLEKRNHNKKTITKIRTENNAIIKGKNLILDKMHQFYKKLYTSKGERVQDDDNYFQNRAPKLTEEQKEIGEQPITEHEILAALKHVKPNKSPGSDGLPGEFYKVFWKDIKKYLMESIKHALNSGSLSITQKHGIISLLPKQGRDTLLLKNWRPITLLNQDYKLVAKALAFRIKNILPSVIHPDQTGFVKNRFIGENINRIFNIMDYVEKEDIAAIIMSIDYEKAFDFLEWDFIQKALTFFNFGEGFKKWIHILYHDINSCVINNGWTSGSIKPSRGVRQGCPMSPYLFIICAEMFAIEIRTNDSIKGIKIGEHTHKIIQFADDTALTLQYEQQNIKNVCKLLSKFSAVSGLNINLEKTAIMRIGSIKHSLEVLMPQATK